MKDSLTEAYSRRALNVRLEEELERSGRTDKPLTLMVIDLDHFKSINDAFGHQRGDEILRLFVLKVQELLRGYDLIFRFGGDEFIVLLPSTDKTQSIHLAGRIQDEIHNMEFAGTPPLSFTISIGIATFPLDTSDPSKIFDKADMRMLEAKNKGRGLIVSEDSQRLDNLIDTNVSQWIVRENASDLITDFTSRLKTEKQGILSIIGPRGSGRTRCLKEIKDLVEFKDFHCMEWFSQLDHRTQQYASLKSTFTNAGIDISCCQDKKDYLDILLKVLTQKHITRLILLVDNIDFMDLKSLDFLSHLIRDRYLTEIGIIFTIDPMNDNRMVPLSAPLEMSVTLQGLSIQGLETWLTEILDWDAPDTFVAWLHRETNGLPLFVNKGLIYLLKRGVISSRNDGDISLESGYEDIPLADRIRVKSGESRHNLPDPGSVFVGRGPELEDIGTLLDDHRLVTLTGPGGVGKTRLALKIADDKYLYFQDGVYFVPLAGLTSSEFIISTIIDAMQLKLTGAVEPKDQLMTYLKEKEMLVVLDNFEHLLNGGVVLVQELIEHCPGIVIMITSRERLNLQGEQIYEIRGMRFPGSMQHPYAGETIENFSAIELFVHRAQTVKPDFELTDETTKDIISICELITGLPLGIEMSAAWINDLTCSEIADKVRDNIDFLQASSDDMPDRHQNMRAVFNYSWHLLSENEKELFRKLTIFRGGFTREAAGEITGASILELAVLLDKSLIYRTLSKRYYIHEVLRQYGQEKLEVDKATFRDVNQEHTEYYAGYVENAGKLFSQGKEKEFLDQINSEIDNIREGWRIAVSSLSIETAHKYLNALQIYYGYTGFYQDGDRIFQSAYDFLKKTDVEPTDSDEFKNLIGGICFYRASYLYSLARYEESKKEDLEGYHLFRETGWENLEELAMNHLGMVDWRLGNLDQAKKWFDDCLALQETRENQSNIFKTINNLAVVEESLNNRERALELYERCLEHNRTHGSKQEIAQILSNLAGATNNANLQVKYVKESLEIYRESGHKEGIARSSLNLGLLEGNRGNHLLALELIRESLDSFRDMDSKFYIANAFNTMGSSYLRLLDFDNAEKSMKEAVQLFQETKNSQGTIQSRNGLGRLEMLRGNYKNAEWLFQESFEASSKMNYTIWIAESVSQLGELNLQMNQLDIAGKKLHKSLEIYRQLKFIDGVADDLLKLGIVYRKQNDIDKAKRFFQESVTLSDESVLMRYLSSCYSQMARIALVEKQQSNAIDLLKKSAQIAHSLQSPIMKIEAILAAGHYLLQYENSSQMETIIGKILTDSAMPDSVRIEASHLLQRSDMTSTGKESCHYDTVSRLEFLDSLLLDFLHTWCDQ